MDALDTCVVNLSVTAFVFHVLNKITILMDLIVLFCQAMKIPARQWQSTRLHQAKS